jgi:hypothetical protein
MGGATNIVKDPSASGIKQDISKQVSEEKLREIEENLILKRWKSPSIIEAL